MGNKNIAVAEAQRLYIFVTQQLWFCKVMVTIAIVSLCYTRKKYGGGAYENVQCGNIKENKAA